MANDSLVLPLRPEHILRFQLSQYLTDTFTEQHSKHIFYFICPSSSAFAHQGWIFFSLNLIAKMMVKKSTVIFLKENLIKCMYHIHLLTHRGQSKSSDDVVSPSTPPDTWRNLIDGSPLSSWNDPNKTRLINRNACLLKG